MAAHTTFTEQISNKQNNKSRKGRKANLGMVKSTSGVPRPPQINNLNPATNFKIRYNMSAGTVPINKNAILASVGNVAATSVLLYNYWGSFKISTIEMWCPAVNNGTTECSVEWIGGSFGNNKLVQDTSNSVTYPAHIKTSPPKQNSASFWQSGDTVDIFTITTSASNTIVDLSIQLMMTDNTFGVVPTVVVGATAGSVYYLGLDGLPSGSSDFAVLTLPTL